jgi:quinol monooxygenase YgiN
MLRVNCFFQANEGCFDEALQAAMALTAESQLHQGCKAYDVFESATRPDVFMFCETWLDEESLALHEQTPEFAEYAGILSKCGTLKIEKFEF